MDQDPRQQLISSRYQMTSRYCHRGGSSHRPAGSARTKRRSRGRTQSGAMGGVAVRRTRQSLFAHAGSAGRVSWLDPGHSLTDAHRAGTERASHARAEPARSTVRGSGTDIDGDAGIEARSDPRACGRSRGHIGDSTRSCHCGASRCAARDDHA